MKEYVCTVCLILLCGATELHMKSIIVLQSAHSKVLVAIHCIDLWAGIDYGYF
jgi:hypothetical protein